MEGTGKEVRTCWISDGVGGVQRSGFHGQPVYLLRFGRAFGGLRCAWALCKHLLVQQCSVVLLLYLSKRQSLMPR